MKAGEYAVNDAYELLAMGMRYVFIALIIYILIRIVLYSVKEYRVVKQIKKRAEPLYTGYITVRLPEKLAGERFPLSQETTIGSARRCDIVFENCGLEPVHAAVYEKKGEVYLSDYGTREGSWLNGERLGKKPKPLMEGDLIEMGELALILHLPGKEEECEQD